MASFTKKVLGLAGAAITFAGMAFGQQATCAAPTATTTIVRAEGTAEQVAPLTFVCTSALGQAAGLAINAQVFLSPALPVTSKVIVSGTSKTEATLTVTSSAGGSAVILGTVSGSTINFSGLAPAVAALPATGTLTFVITNVRVNATSLSVGSGVPPSISETVFVSGPAVVPAALASSTVGFAQNGLAALRTFRNFANGVGAVNTPTGFPQSVTVVGSTAGANNFVVCNPYSVARDITTLGQSTAALAAYAAGSGKSLAAVVEVGENFAQAFRTAGGEVSQTVYASGVGVGTPAETTTASNGVISTRFKLSFTNVPAGVTLVAPVGAITSTSSGLTATWVTSDTGGTAATSDGLTGEGTITALRAVPITSGAGSVTFSIGGVDDTTNLDRFEIPIFVITASNGAAAGSTPFSVSASFAPVGSTSIPNFVVGASTAAVTLSSFSSCTTSLLFPFVTNQLGFDTGIAISNTSSDPFGAANGATAQAGTCALNFYGSGAPSPANVTTPNVPTGTVYTQVLSGVAAGFQGYIIAQCSFQYAHGFAFITNGVGVNGGLSQGYLAGVIPDVNQKARGADPLSSAGAGTGETLGN